MRSAGRRTGHPVDRHPYLVPVARRAAGGVTPSAVTAFSSTSAATWDAACVHWPNWSARRERHHPHRGRHLPRQWTRGSARHRPRTGPQCCVAEEPWRGCCIATWLRAASQTRRTVDQFFGRGFGPVPRWFADHGSTSMRATTTTVSRRTSRRGLRKSPAAAGCPATTTTPTIGRASLGRRLTRYRRASLVDVSMALDQAVTRVAERSW